MNIYVGNLPFTVSEDEIRQAFAAYGTVSSVAIIKDRETGQSRGFAFVEMPNNDEGNQAITKMNGQPLKGRALKVNEARPREEGFGGRGGGGGGGGYGGGGGGYGGGGGGYGGGGGGAGRRTPGGGGGGDRDRRGGSGGGGRKPW
jgi:RNA recognition motif-containing protein